MSTNKNPSPLDSSVNPAAEFMVRQSRFESEGLLTVSFGDKAWPVLNYSLFGIAFRSPEDRPLDSVLPAATLSYNGVPIGEFDLRVKRSEKAGDLYQIGAETIDAVIPVESILRIREIDSVFVSIDEIAARQDRLPVDYRVRVHELAAKLSHLESLAKSVENREYQQRTAREESLSLFVDYLGPRIHHEIKVLTSWMQGTFLGGEPETVKAACHFFRDALGKFIFQSPFTKRSFEKPRGYAGDYEMMNQIYRNEGHSTTLFGACMEVAIQKFEEPTAVRNRSRYLAENIMRTVQIVTGDCRILSVASGPAQEIKIILEKLGQADLDRTTFVLLDQDQEALAYAQRSIQTEAIRLSKRVNLVLKCVSVKEIFTAGLKTQPFHLIYSAGLFDYFTDPVASKLSRLLGAAVDAGGSLVIGNFNLTSPNAMGMAALFDWTLILRSEQDLHRLFDQKNFETRIEREPENVNLFCVLKRRG